MPANNPASFIIHSKLKALIRARIDYPGTFAPLKEKL
jgi:hypothetical protein